MIGPGSGEILFHGFQGLFPVPVSKGCLHTLPGQSQADTFSDSLDGTQHQGNFTVLLDKVISKFGRLDILVNNIERGGWPIVHGPYVREQWDLEMATTLRAKWWTFNSALPHLKASGNGVVLNFSSIAGIVGRYGPAGRVFNDGYAAANRAVSSLTETWARQAAPEVRVNELMLGFVETRHGPKTRGWGLLTENHRQDIVDHTLVKRLGHVEDVTRAVLYVIRDAPFMTGSVIRLDGGFTLGAEYMEPMPEGVID